ncbi:MAG: DUF1801 domain-containing protein [Anaerolineales bacterium]|nr:MAG: DUF1801 domain-containing protein [Anaerolineales bacterium]
MVSSKAKTVTEYLKELPEERRKAISAVRKVIRENLPKGFEEGMTFGMITYYIPLKDFPETYNGQPLGIAALASQKNYMAVYLNNIYSEPATTKWFMKRYEATGKRMDIGKSCVRFRKLEDLPLDLIGEAVAMNSKEKLLEMYVDARTSSERAKK